jgi:hypothetical protein
VSVPELVLPLEVPSRVPRRPSNLKVPSAPGKCHWSSANIVCVVSSAVSKASSAIASVVSVASSAHAEASGSGGAASAGGSAAASSTGSATTSGSDSVRYTGVVFALIAVVVGMLAL